MAKRQYRNVVQAEVATLTRERIMNAALVLLPENWIDQITLEMIANHAQVTVQTILRHFGSKEALLISAGQIASEQATVQREEASVGDITGGVNNLTMHYEAMGDRVIRLLAQEERYSQLKTLLQEGRGKHREWVERVFAPYLSERADDDQKRLLAQLITLCDVYTWKLLRRDSGLSEEQYKLALYEMLSALFS